MAACQNPPQELEVDQNPECTEPRIDLNVLGANICTLQEVEWSHFSQSVTNIYAFVRKAFAAL